MLKQFDLAWALHVLPKLIRASLVDAGTEVVIHYGKSKKTKLPFKASLPLDEKTFKTLAGGKKITFFNPEGKTKTIKPEKIKGFTFQSPKDFDYADRLKFAGDFPLKGEGKVYGFANNGNEYVARNVEEMKANALYFWYVGMLEKDISKKKRFNCVFYEEGQGIKLKSFTAKSGFYNKPMEYVKTGSKVLWLGCENKVTLSLKNQTIVRTVEVDFKKDGHLIKTFKANGRKLGGKTAMSLDNLISLTVHTAKKKGKK